MTRRSQLSVTILVLYIVGSATSIRNLSSMALFGTHVAFFYAMAALGILIPTALITAEMGLRSPDRSGIFAWCHDHIGPRAGLLAIWLQWINTVVWYPGVLAFIASSVAYLIDPTLAKQPGFVFSAALAAYWLLTLMNTQGIQLSATFSAACTALGLIIPMLALLGFAAFWLFGDSTGPALQLNWHQLVPTHVSEISLPAITATITSCLGMELVAVYAPQIRNPKRNLPKALVWSCQIIAISTTLGALAITLLVPRSELSLIAGTLQSFTLLTHKLHLQALLPWLVASILIGATGGMMNWMLSPAEGLRQASAAGLLPRWLNQSNAHGAPSRILCLQAVLVSLFSLAYVLMPNLNTAYWLLTDISTELYLAMYPMLFWVAYKMLPLKGKASLLGNRWLMALCLIGTLTCAVALVAGFVPPANLGFHSTSHYACLVAGGLVLMVSPVLLCQIRPKHQA